MSIQRFDRMKNKWSILVVFFVMLSMTASLISALSSVQANTDFPLLPGGKFVKLVPSSPLQGSDWQVYIPPSSLSKPGNTGLTAHTNYMILVPPNGTVITPV